MREVEMQECRYEENLFEDHHILSNFIRKKKENLQGTFRSLENWNVFKDLQNNFTFPNRFSKLNDFVQYDKGLPIYAKKKEFISKFSKNQVIIFKSNAGSGKSTQLPQYLLDCTEGRILITEPRAIAAENVGSRVAQELESVEGNRKCRDMIGYITGPKYRLSARSCKIVYLTENEFIKQVIEDRDEFLKTFDTFMIDEAHELRKASMVILAILKNHLLANQSCKLIVTSATLDTQLFEEYFQDTDLKQCFIEAITPTYDVEVHYTQFPDLESSIIENTVAHLRFILEVVSDKAARQAMW